jgi:hypothetical protein
MRSRLGRLPTTRSMVSVSVPWALARMWSPWKSSPKRKASRASGGVYAQRGRKEPLRGSSARRGCQATIESIMDGRTGAPLTHQDIGARPVMDVPRWAYTAPQRLAAAFRDVLPCPPTEPLPHLAPRRDVLVEGAQ